MGSYKSAMGWSRYRDANPVPTSPLADDDIATVPSGPVIFISTELYEAFVLNSFIYLFILTLTHPRYVRQRLSPFSSTHCGGKRDISYTHVFHVFFPGELHVPLEVCGAVVKRELDFWQINEYEIRACCWRHYRSYIENQRILDSFNKSLYKEAMSVNLDGLTGWSYWQMKIWLILEYPRTSRSAMVGWAFNTDLIYSLMKVSLHSAYYTFSCSVS